MFIELFILLVITIVSYKLISKKILIPINNLKNDMISYKKGIMPERRDKTTTIDELQNNFIDLTVALESEKEKQNQIIASITHDIKTPLTSIMGYAKRLETVKLSEEKKVEYIKKISSKSIRMKELISEFDDYLGCNLNSNLDKKPILIKDYILSIRKEFEEELKEKNIKLRIKNKTHSNDEIIIDEVKMKRVFSNIINNSIRYLQGDNKIIKILIEKKEENIRFEIMDNGIGVEKNIIDKIFDPLFTTDSGRKISGLGLSICREIIKVHQGEIKAKNNRYGGLSIIFYIPSNYDII
jgi:signal transduction histidine kinase